MTRSVPCWCRRLASPVLDCESLVHVVFDVYGRWMRRGSVKFIEGIKRIFVGLRSFASCRRLSQLDVTRNVTQGGFCVRPLRGALAASKVSVRSKEKAGASNPAGRAPTPQQPG
jgi:hypothetical protein